MTHCTEEADDNGRGDPDRGGQESEGPPPEVASGHDGPDVRSPTLSETPPCNIM